MTDRELLEMAAKAARIEDEFVQDSDPVGRGLWNPLTDDGDALRLAVKLSIYVQPFTESARPSVFARSMNRIGTESIEHFDEHGGDATAATRRAIVRAAAQCAGTNLA